MDSLKISLREHFGWDSFKTGQRAIIEAVLSGKDSIAVLPTGGGKSLCYQLPALIANGLVVVVSPLVSLMEDQVRKLRDRNITAICLHSGLDIERRNSVINTLKDSNNQLRLLYISPERINSKLIQEFLYIKGKKKQIIAIAIDEAHCISSWGHDFRPNYRRLDLIRSLCPDVPIVALSATAPPKVRADIIRLLHLQNPLIQVCSARRHNLHYSIKTRAKEPLVEILEALKCSRGASLIYVRTRRLVEYWTQKLNQEGIPAIGYHGGLDYLVREKALNNFLSKSSPVLVATVAFGMGVDRSDVGLVLHLDLPPNPERYLQESGRAGRDGLPANCVILFSPIDRIKLGWLTRRSNSTHENSLSDDDQILRNNLILEQIRLMEEIAEGERCIEQALLLEVGEIVSPCGRCDKCKKFQVKEDYTKNASILLGEIQKNEEIDVQKLIKNLSPTIGLRKNQLGWLIRRLIKEKLIIESNDGKQKLSLKEIGVRYLHDPWQLLYQKIG